jgi:hypothetical protein
MFMANHQPRFLVVINLEVELQINTNVRLLTMVNRVKAMIMELILKMTKEA